MTADLVRVGAVALAFAGILAAAELVRSRGHVRTEWTRKLVHLLSGLVAAAFPWLFESPWPVTALAAGYAVLMTVTRRSGWLASVHDVRRRTRGGVLYPVAVAVVFWLAGSHRYAYVAAILTLAVGDAAAALVGRAFGTLRYRVFGAARSLEGSAAMALAAYPCIHLSLALLTPLGPMECVAWSVSVTALATLVEASAPRGSDNLLVPVSTCLALLAAPGGFSS